MFLRKYKLEDKFPRNKDGFFMDQNGKPITHERILKYDNLARMVTLRTHDKDTTLYGPGYIEDVYQVARSEGVIFCLIHWDESKALAESTAPDSRRRSGLSNSEWSKKKRANPQEVLEQLEFDFVSTGLWNALRRLAHEYGEGLAKKNGRQIFLLDYEQIEHMICRDEDQSSFDDYEDKKAQVSVPDFSVGDSGISNKRQACADYEKVLSLAIDGKADEAKSFFDSLSAARKDDVKAYKETLSGTTDRSQFLAEIAENARKAESEE